MAEPAHLAATRAGYDRVAERYTEAFRHQLATAPVARAMPAAFAELVRRDHPEPRGARRRERPRDRRRTRAGLGLAVRGIDLSPAMVELARREHPDIAFDVGEVGALDLPDADLARRRRRGGEDPAGPSSSSGSLPDVVWSGRISCAVDVENVGPAPSQGHERPGRAA